MAKINSVDCHKPNEISGYAAMFDAIAAKLVLSSKAGECVDVTRGIFRIVFNPHRARTATAKGELIKPESGIVFRNGGPICLFTAAGGRNLSGNSDEHVAAVVAELAK